MHQQELILFRLPFFFITAHVLHPGIMEYLLLRIHPGDSGPITAPIPQHHIRHGVHRFWGPDHGKESVET